MSSPDGVAESVVRDRLHVVARRPPQTPVVPPVQPPGVPASSRRARRGAVDPSASDPAASDRAADDGLPWLPVRPSGGHPAVPDGHPGAAQGDQRPADAARTGPPAPGDVADVVTRRRAEALATAAAGYSAAYGHPLHHPVQDGVSPGVRWRLSTRQAVVVGVAVLVLAAGIVVRAWSGIPGPPAALDVAVGPGAAASSAPGSAEAARSSVEGTGTDPVGSSTVAAGAGGPDVAAGGATGTVTGAAPGTGGSVVVHVVGQVVAPGVLSLPAGSRVADAVAAAGGPAPDADLAAVNLARPVTDGEQLRVPAHGEPPVPPGPADPAVPGGRSTDGGAGAAPVLLNTADLAALDALPGIGPVLAGRILAWRAENGPFRSVEELGEVSGIGDALLARLRPLVRV